MRRAYVKPFDITDKPMRGWVMVEAQGVAYRAALVDWLDKARAFVSIRPPK